MYLNIIHDHIKHNRIYIYIYIELSGKTLALKNIRDVNGNIDISTLSMNLQDKIKRLQCWREII